MSKKETYYHAFQLKVWIRSDNPDEEHDGPPDFLHSDFNKDRSVAKLESKRREAAYSGDRYVCKSIPGVVIKVDGEPSFYSMANPKTANALKSLKKEAEVSKSKKSSETIVNGAFQFERILGWEVPVHLKKDGDKCLIMGSSKHIIDFPIQYDYDDDAVKLIMSGAPGQMGIPGEGFTFEQGFISSLGLFYNKAKAAKVAFAAGQISEKVSELHPHHLRK